MRCLWFFGTALVLCVLAGALPIEDATVVPDEEPEMTTLPDEDDAVDETTNASEEDEKERDEAAEKKNDEEEAKVEEREQSKFQDPLEKIYEECDSVNSFECSQVKLVSLLDKWAMKKSVPILNVFSIQKTSSLPEEVIPPASSKGESDLNEALAERIEKYLKTHSIRFKIPGEDFVSSLIGKVIGEKTVDIGLDFLADGEGQGRGKLKKLILPILLGLKMKLAVLIPIVLGTIALIGFKALIASSISLVISIVVGLKSLVSHKEEHAKPIYYPHDHHDEWSRNSYEYEYPVADNHPYRGYYYKTPSSFRDK